MKKRTKNSMFRSKAGWYGEGEKYTKYLVNLEKLRYNQRTMVCLVRQDGTVSRNQKEILKMQARFYQEF